MTTSQKIAKSEASISAMDAIFHRRAVRDYTLGKIDEAVIRKLLEAAVHAPTAIHGFPRCQGQAIYAFQSSPFAKR